MTCSNAIGNEQSKERLTEARVAELMTDSNVLDLYEEMLFARAVKGIRPLLYVSSDKDLACCVQKLLGGPREEMWEQHRFVIPGVGLRATTSHF